MIEGDYKNLCVETSKGICYNNKLIIFNFHDSK